VNNRKLPVNKKRLFVFCYRLILFQLKYLNVALEVLYFSLGSLKRECWQLKGKNFRLASVNTTP